MNMFLCCIDVFRDIILLLKKHPEITTWEELVGIIENNENLEEFISRCEIGLYNDTGIDKIKKVAQNQLKKLS
jgi:hypothetical protein